MGEGRDRRATRDEHVQKLSLAASAMPLGVRVGTPVVAAPVHDEPDGSDVSEVSRSRSVGLAGSTRVCRVCRACRTCRAWWAATSGGKEHAAGCACGDADGGNACSACWLGRLCRACWRAERVETPSRPEGSDERRWMKSDWGGRWAPSVMQSWTSAALSMGVGGSGGRSGERAEPGRGGSGGRVGDSVLRSAECRPGRQWNSCKVAINPRGGVARPEGGEARGAAADDVREAGT